MKIYGSKKATVTLGGVAVIPLVLGLLTVLLESLSVEPAMITHIQEVIGWALAVLLSSYNVGQSLADLGKEAPPSAYELTSVELTSE